MAVQVVVLVAVVVIVVRLPLDLVVAVLVLGALVLVVSELESVSMSVESVPLVSLAGSSLDRAVAAVLAVWPSLPLPSPRVLPTTLSTYCL